MPSKITGIVIHHIAWVLPFTNYFPILCQVRQQFGVVYDIEFNTKFRVLILKRIKAMWTMRNNFYYRFFFK